MEENLSRIIFRIMSRFFDHDTIAQLKALGRTVLLLFGLGAGVTLLFLVFLWELHLDRPFAETGPTEIIQSLLLLTSSALFFLEAFRRPDLRGAMLLVGGFIGCMLIREQDYFLDFLRHGCWVYPALTLTAGCIGGACLTPRRTLAGLEHFVRWKYFPFLLIGLVIVLAYSRLFGMRMLWELLLGDNFSYTAKKAMEESSELLGYLFIQVSAILTNSDKRL